MMKVLTCYTMLLYYKIGSNRNLLFIALQSAVGILITIQSK
ncbi:hypothetical protein Nizo1839_0869 [Lactiplantibacillus plantarum]|nr:Hypothetical protein zj316_2716 [Lactiplantibacillus plantarum ZJ316]ERO40343.1 hypothetical protein LPLWJ_25300 [Lactiplantibacillus plantarum WJL]KTF03035.1 hypothetical protein SF2A35B_0336 [Lactiplantibacillus plantarum]KZT82336.1 hypothetical protein Nizo1839_0869 [Lactiplantibacillus plantarum]KZU11575.1 hypothetical protein Nizo2264_2516 [Lactiplantibacillus plantarum]